MSYRRKFVKPGPKTGKARRKAWKHPERLTEILALKFAARRIRNNKQVLDGDIDGLTYRVWRNELLRCKLGRGRRTKGASA